MVESATYVVDDMVMGDVVKEEAALPAQEVTIDGRSSTALEVPFLATIVRELRVSVVEIRDHNNLM